LIDLQNRYIELLKLSLLDAIYDPNRDDRLTPDRLWPRRAHTMLNRERMDNLQMCVETALMDNIPGDLIETGVWRGGATIFMRGILKAYADDSRRVWVADSFCGLPPPDENAFPADKGDRHYERSELAVTLDEVKANFAKYNLLDEAVVFLEGWFRDTLPKCAAERFAVLRLDGDMYESTIEALESLYPKLSPGGFVIIDDYGAVEGCRRAVCDFRLAHAIEQPLIDIDWTGKYWRRG
jgi:O-methyltransferase